MLDFPQLVSCDLIDRLVPILVYIVTITIDFEIRQTPVLIIGKSVWVARLTWYYPPSLYRQWESCCPFESIRRNSGESEPIFLWQPLLCTSLFCSNATCFVTRIMSPILFRHPTGLPSHCPQRPLSEVWLWDSWTWSLGWVLLKPTILDLDKSPRLVWSFASSCPDWNATENVVVGDSGVDFPELWSTQNGDVPDHSRGWFGFVWERPCVPPTILWLSFWFWPNS